MIIDELTYCDPVLIYEAFAHLPGSVFLDGHIDYFSYIGIDPFKRITNVLESPFTSLKQNINNFSFESMAGLPPFQGGLLGYWGYDLCAKMENIQLPKPDEFSLPDMIIGFYDLVIGFDHRQKQAWVMSSGLPERHPVLQKKRAEKRLNWVSELLKQHKFIAENQNNFIDPGDITSNFTHYEYCLAVEKVKEYILNGDVFETNIAQRFQVDLPKDYSIYELYRRLRTSSKAPFSSYLNFGDVKIASASPERFLQVKSKNVETKPIKGTLPRGKTKEEDMQLAQQLLQSEKDKAENTMIVDLMRNDLSKVCLPDSVQVQKLCALESFSNVHHLVSTIQATLGEEYDAIDLLEACYPGGSITGAPKIRSMEIISEIEPHRRGAYCGAIGYISFNGEMDTSITIRTLTANKNKLCFHAGGAIVLDSDPQDEYQETLDKASVMINALTNKQWG